MCAEVLVMMEFNIKNHTLQKLFPIITMLVIFLRGSESFNLYSLETRYIEVPVDHFSATSIPKSFYLRYMVNAKYYHKGGPVFVYTGGERDIAITAQNTGFLFDIAPIFNAVLVFIEHRYYGTSLPFGNASFATVENLKYLSTTQALADFAFLIDALKKKFFQKAEPPFIAFGGYYGGMLAAWLRLKYPFSVDGAITSSAPILYFPELTSCEGYYKTVTRVFKVFGQEKCVKTIKLGWEVILDLTKTNLGKDYISSTWNLCSKLKTPEDVDLFLDWLANVYIKLAMVNYPYSSEYFEPVPAYPVISFCNKLTTAYVNNTKGFIKNYADALQIYTNYTGKTDCINIFHKQEDSNEVAWQYQTCTELIMPRCSTDEDMFLTKNWSYQQFVLNCYKQFGVRSRPNAFLTYGGKNVNYYSNIVFSNSMLDPGSWGGVYLKSADILDDTLLIYQIADAPHLMDLRGSNPADDNNILKARQFYISTIKKWLTQG